MSLSKQEQKQPVAMLSASSSSATTTTSSLPTSLPIPPRRSSNSQLQYQKEQFATLAMLQQHHPPPQKSSASRTSPTRHQQHQYNGSSSSSSSSSRHNHNHHHKTSSSSISAANQRASLRSVPEGDWLAPPQRRPRKPSLSMASVAAGAAGATALAAASGSGSVPASTTSASASSPPAAVPPRSSSSHATTGPTSSSFYATSSSRPISTLTITPQTAPAALAPAAPVAAAAAKPDPIRYATEDFNFSARHTWTEEKEHIVCGPFEYLNGVKGKEFRTQLINAFNGWLEVPKDALAVITRVVGMLHTASLLIDDVEDSSSLRRGLPVAHNIFGIPQTINSANYIYFMALQEVQTLHNPTALAIFAEELCNLHRGQGMDLFWRDTLTCPSEDDYLEMVGHKTGGLFRLGIKLMQAESPTLVDCVPLVNLLGLIFQIQDDYRNLMATEYSQNKGMCEDLTEGKFSFPVIHSIRSSGGSAVGGGSSNNNGDAAGLQLLNILKQRTNDEEVKRYAVAHMERTGSFAYTREVLAVLTDRARKLADELDEGKGRSKAVHAILDRLMIN